MNDEGKIIRLPGLIDAHVQLRDPGQTDKEDFLSGTKAAVAGGFTTVIDMPNNAEPITSIERLKQKIEIAQSKTIAEIGFHYGSMGDNLESFAEAAELTLGLKLYLNKTTGGYLLSPRYLRKIYAAWPKSKPVLLHAEEDVIDVAIESMKELNRPIHVCHMPSKYILEKIIIAKKTGLPITCGVCPHHLFLNEKDEKRLGVYGKMLPSLKPQEDQDYLWENLQYIDIFESDHAPHTHKEKQEGAFGVPGLETTLPLLLTAYKQGKISLEDIIEKCHTNPAKIFNIPVSEKTYIEVVMSDYQINNEKLFTKCGWSPFHGVNVNGKVIKTVIGGRTVFENGQITAEAGSGKVLKG